MIRRGHFDTAGAPGGMLAVGEKDEVAKRLLEPLYSSSLWAAAKASTDTSRETAVMPV